MAFPDVLAPQGPSVAGRPQFGFRLTGFGSRVLPICAPYNYGYHTVTSEILETIFEAAE